MSAFDDLDLGKMPFAAVLSMAESRSRLTREEIADRMRENLSVINRSFDPAADYFFRAHRLPYLCHVMGDDTLIRWLVARLAYLDRNAGTEPVCAPLSVHDGLARLADLMKEVGEAATAIVDASKGQCIQVRDARRIRREVIDVIKAAMEILPGLEAVERQDRGE